MSNDIEWFYETDQEGNSELIIAETTEPGRWLACPTRQTVDVEGFR